MLLTQSSLWFLIRLHFLHWVQWFCRICWFFFIFEIQHFRVLLCCGLSLCFCATGLAMWTFLTVCHWVNWKVWSLNFFTRFLFTIKEFVLFIRVFFLFLWLFRRSRFWLIFLFWICFGHGIHYIQSFSLWFCWSWAWFALGCIRYRALNSRFVWWRFPTLAELVWNCVWRSIVHPFW